MSLVIIEYSIDPDSTYIPASPPVYIIIIIIIYYYCYYLPIYIIIPIVNDRTIGISSTETPARTTTTSTVYCFFNLTGVCLLACCCRWWSCLPCLVW